MPKLKNYEPGKRVSVWLPHESFKMWGMLDNKSKFLQLALRDAIGIMAMDILRHRRPDLYTSPEKLEDVLEPYNEQNPLNELTKKRQKCNENSPNKPELW